MKSLSSPEIKEMSMEHLFSLVMNMTTLEIISLYLIKLKNKLEHITKCFYLSLNYYFMSWHMQTIFPRAFYLDEKALDLTQSYGQISYNQPSDLTSDKLIHLGGVLFKGTPPTSEDNLLLANAVANEFKKDIATDFYSFVSPMEDLAMNTQESLMLY